jgi:hypothetical protein
MAAGQIPGGGPKARLLGLFRSLLVNGFMSHFDRRAVAPLLRQIVEIKVQDPHMSEVEVAGMWGVVRQAEGPA